LIVSSEVIEHLFLPRRLPETAFALLRPGGLFILTTPYHGYMKNLALSLMNKWDDHHTVHHDGGHIKFFSEKTLRELLENSGFAALTFNNAGRLPWLWKSMVCRAQRPAG
jgi:2-polyprenyl-6-hydroxyphenyl methylase/3-demethylubiquinone-9 3-methyltransferase